MIAAPPLEVQRAFGLAHEPTLLSSSSGGVWLADGVVLKRAPDPTEASFVAELTTRLPAVATAVATSDGEWTHSGWSGTTYVAAAPDPGRWDEILDLGDELHHALADLDPAWPPALDSRRTPWAIADRVTWQEQPLPDDLVTSQRELVEGLLSYLQQQGPSSRPRQVVHGDLAGNVLFRATGRPVVIDLSPYRRPPAYARSVVVVDQVCWHGAPAGRAASVDRCDLARAIVFRVVAAALHSPAHGAEEVARAKPLLRGWPGLSDAWT